MHEYIVLLRGINISGKNKISMSELKKYLELMNYTDVKTYLNSGNIIIKSIISSESIIYHLVLINQYYFQLLQILQEPYLCFYHIK